MTAPRSTRTRMVGALILATILSASCARLGMGFSRIGDILAAPEKYTGKEVLIRGTVSGALQVPLVPVRLFTVRDATGEIKVRTDKPLPPSGTEVHVRGVLDTLAVVNGQNIGLYVRETERW